MRGPVGLQSLARRSAGVQNIAFRCGHSGAWTNVACFGNVTNLPRRAKRAAVTPPHKHPRSGQIQVHPCSGSTSEARRRSNLPTWAPRELPGAAGVSQQLPRSVGRSSWRAPPRNFHRVLTWWPNETCFPRSFESDSLMGQTLKRFGPRRWSSSPRARKIEKDVFLSFLSARRKKSGLRLQHIIYNVYIYGRKRT